MIRFHRILTGAVHVLCGCWNLLEDADVGRQLLTASQRDTPLTLLPPLAASLQHLGLVAAVLLGTSSAVGTRQPPSPSQRWRAFAFLPAFNPWLLWVRPGCISAPAQLPAGAPVLHMSAPVRQGASVAARLGLA